MEMLKSTPEFAQHLCHDRLGESGRFAPSYKQLSKLAMPFGVYGFWQWETRWLGFRSNSL
jgi:hypothetical protein